MIKSAVLVVSAIGLIHGPAGAIPQDSGAAKSAAPGVSRKLAPRGAPQGWVLDNDYPASSLWEHQEGAVGFRLDVGPDGRTVGCAVTASSGHSMLDERTCSLLRRRARFYPALDAQGQPVAAEFNGRFAWKLPHDSAPWASWQRRTRVDLAQGRVIGCEIEEMGTPETLTSDLCGYIGRMPSDVVDIITGEADTVTLTVIERHAVSGKPLAKPIAEPAGKRMFRHSITYDVLPDGKAAACKLAGSEGADFLVRVRFRCHPGLDYPAAADTALRRGSMTITVTTSGAVPVMPGEDTGPAEGTMTS